jgi:carbon starvation protein CstA
MKNVAANARYWIAGTTCAVLGVLLARVIAPHLEKGPRLWFTIGGQLLAIVGLVVICVGVSRRVKRDSALLEDTPPPRP